VLRSQVGSGGLDASATALDRWSHGAIAAHADDLDALAELADLESDASRFPAWLAEQLGAPGDPTDQFGIDPRRQGPGVAARRSAPRHRGLLPHRLAEDLEEERRVFHVALTRCSISTRSLPGRRRLISSRARATCATECARRVARSSDPGARFQAAPLRRETSARIELLIGAAGSRFSPCAIADSSSSHRWSPGTVGGGPATTLAPSARR